MQPMPIRFAKRFAVLMLLALCAGITPAHDAPPGDTVFWPRLESPLERVPMPPAPKDTPVSSVTPIVLEVGR